MEKIQGKELRFVSTYYIILQMSSLEIIMEERALIYRVANRKWTAFKKSNVLC